MIKPEEKKLDFIVKYINYKLIIDLTEIANSLKENIICIL